MVDADSNPLNRNDFVALAGAVRARLLSDPSINLGVDQITREPYNGDWEQSLDWSADFWKQPAYLLFRLRASESCLHIALSASREQEPTSRWSISQDPSSLEIRVFADREGQQQPLRFQHWLLRKLPGYDEAAPNLDIELSQAVRKILVP